MLLQKHFYKTKQIFIYVNMRINSLFLAILFSLALVQANIRPVALKTEGLVKPEGVDMSMPRLSWQLKADNQSNVLQKAYRIIVASSPQLLQANKGDVWDSGKTKSDVSLWIPFAGTELKSSNTYYWKVKVWTNKGETEWSEPTHWSMGLLNEIEWKAQWIGLDRAMPWDSETQWSRLSARYLRKEFEAKKEIKNAMVHVSGLGLYELFINGQRIGDQVLAPAPTDYRKSILYNTYNVTETLKKGQNAVGVALGNGRYYTMRQNYKPYKIPTFGYPKLRLHLMVEYTDGSKELIATNNTWKLTADGPIRNNNEYDGEEYDARKELGAWTMPGYDDKTWMAAERVAIPQVAMRAQMMPGMKVVDKLNPISMKKMGDKYMLDMGQNMVGWLRINIKAKHGDSIQMRFAETLQANGELYTENLRDALVTDLYISNGNAKGETWAPAFVYHGFRFVEITGLRYEPKISDFVGEVVNDEMQETGHIHTSNAVLNQVLKNAWWGIRGNYKGMPVDCPQRNERQPWLGDRTMGVWGESYFFDNNALYQKWGADIREAQRYDGSIPDVAPAYWNYYSDNVTWPAALPMLCDMTYTQFGNRRPIDENYDAIKKWLNHMKNNYMTADYILTKDQYGDWCVPPESLEMIHSRDPRRQTDGALISTAYYYHILNLMTKFANLRNNKADAKSFANLAQNMGKAFHEKFFRTDSLFYGNNTATSNLLPLAFGIVPKQYADTVAKQILYRTVPANTASQIGTGDLNLTTGVVGIQFLLRELSKMGRADVAFALASNDKYPSWGYMAANGATTIWELWNGNTASPKMNSGNHVMLLGDLIPWTFENLAGIKSDREKLAFKHIVMKPNFDIPNLETIDASYETPYGLVVSKWRKDLMQLQWDIEIPANTTAEVHLPNKKVQRIGSGKHSFTVQLAQPKGVVVSEFLYETAPFPQCHSATILETTSGDLLTAYFGGTREGHPDVSIYTSRKTKGSKGWAAPQLVADGVYSETLRKAAYNPVLYQHNNGTIYLYYKVGSRVSDWVGYVKTSTDEGRTWSAAQQLPDGFLGPIKNKMHVVGDKIIAPSSTEGNSWRVHFEIIDLEKNSYRKVGPLEAEASTPTHLVATNNSSTDIEGGDNSIHHTIQAIQPSILEHKDGRLQILCRTRNGKIATAWSSDQGETWTKLTLLDVPNNNSGTDAVSLSDGTHALIYNAIATPPGAKKGLRTPLNIARSKNGVDWKVTHTLEDSPVSQYSYPAIIQGKDGRIHAVYTWRRQRVKYVELKF